ncbi:Sin3-associated polypeptide SAP18 [Cardiosporidium cionae]|uniref:Sin3-associated polypeptide SAP18 n=1 Tax=Cardiosporidium cionae TaxID=476202 RepID=A0ABQ7JDN3_9APIC|nr:Sin3-associated polypeptide SAP18 [Cardiosporidium cionae]|eukprot:KAF8822086.1 Sin3-associated polypeptide SAP18 [Cardiosporidium cionae]
MTRSRSSKVRSTSRESSPQDKRKAASSKTPLSSSRSSRSRSSSCIGSPSSRRGEKYSPSFRRNRRIVVPRRSLLRESERKPLRDFASTRFNPRNDRRTSRGRDFSLEHDQCRNTMSPQYRFSAKARFYDTPPINKLDRTIHSSRDLNWKKRCERRTYPKKETVGTRSRMDNVERPKVARDSQLPSFSPNEKTDVVSVTNHPVDNTEGSKDVTKNSIIRRGNTNDLNPSPHEKIYAPNTNERLIKMRPFPSVDRSIVPPFLLRVFLKINGEHDITEFATRQKEPEQDELQIYAWMDARLRELVNLVKEVCEETRERNAIWKFRLIYPDKQGHNLMSPIGQVHSTKVDTWEDKKTLQQVKFQIGDYIDLSVLMQHQKTNILQSKVTPTIEKPGTTEPIQARDASMTKNTASAIRDHSTAPASVTLPDSHLQDFSAMS